MSPSVIVSACLKFKNETREFVNDMDHLASVAAGKRTGFTGFAVNVVSVESEDVLQIILCFIYFNIDNAGSTDTNHNMKSW